jgi:hypothetical protein
MLIRKIWTGTMTAVAVVAITSWASMATAALPEDVSAALSPDKTPAQQQAAIQALATANAGNAANFTQLAQLVAAGITAQQAPGMANALGAACAASGNNAQITQAIVSALGGAYPEAGGTIVGQAISAGCSAEVAANTLQTVLLSAAGQFLRLRHVLNDPNPGPGFNIGAEAFLKSLYDDRKGGPRGFVQTQEGAKSPTTVQDKGPEQPVYVPPTSED